MIVACLVALLGPLKAPVAGVPVAGPGWRISWSVPVPADVRCVAVGDLDGDGKASLITLSPGRDAAMVRVFRRAVHGIQRMVEAKVTPGAGLLCGRLLEGMDPDVAVAGSTLVRWTGNGLVSLPLPGLAACGVLRRPSGEALLLARNGGSFAASRLTIDASGHANAAPEQSATLLATPITGFVSGQLALGIDEAATSAPGLSAGDTIAWDAAGGLPGAWYGVAWCGGNRVAAVCRDTVGPATPILTPPARQRVQAVACGALDGGTWSVFVLVLSEPEGKGARLFSMAPDGGTGVPTGAGSASH